MRRETWAKLITFFQGQIPDYVVNAGKRFITIRVGGDFEEAREVRFTIPDVVEYYATQAPNISSGCRKIKDVIGDWRNIDALAKLCLEWFKFVNVEELRRESKKWGLEPKF